MARVYGQLSNPLAISLAQTTWAIFPNFVMSNNLADIYESFGETAKAYELYKACLAMTKNARDLKIIQDKIDKISRRLKK